MLPVLNNFVTNEMKLLTHQKVAKKEREDHMKKNQFRQGICFALLCGCMMFAGAGEARADYEDLTGPEMETGAYVASVGEGGSSIYASPDSEDVLAEAESGKYYQITGDQGDGWLELQVGETKAYISTKDVAVVTKSAMENDGKAVETELMTKEKKAEAVRENLVEFALQFIGCKYKDAGSDPHTGVDCSGFTRYVMKYGAGVNIARSSVAQSGEGKEVSADQMRPGDLVFYSKSGKNINHVAMYIGDGMVVHASTYKTGVKTSPWNYRTPVKIVNVLGD